MLQKIRLEYSKGRASMTEKCGVFTYDNAEDVRVLLFHVTEPKRRIDRPVLVPWCSSQCSGQASLSGPTYYVLRRHSVLTNYTLLTRNPALREPEGSCEFNFSPAFLTEIARQLKVSSMLLNAIQTAASYGVQVKPCSGIRSLRIRRLQALIRHSW